MIRCAGCGRGCRLTGGRRGATRSGVGGGPDDGSDGEPGESLDDRTSPCEPAAASARAGVGTACEAGLWEGLTKRKPAKGPSCAETALAGVARGDCAWGLRSAESTSRTGVAGRSGPGGRLRRVGLALLGALASAARSLGSRDDASPRRCVLGAGHGVCWELSPAGSTEAKSSEPSSAPASAAESGQVAERRHRRCGSIDTPHAGQVIHLPREQVAAGSSYIRGTGTRLRYIWDTATSRRGRARAVGSVSATSAAGARGSSRSLPA